MKPIPLTWLTAMHMGKGLQGAMMFLGETGIATRTWILGPKTHSRGGDIGWSQIDDEVDRRIGGEGGRGEEVDVAEAVGVG